MLLRDTTALMNKASPNSRANKLTKLRYAQRVHLQLDHPPQERYELSGHLLEEFEPNPQELNTDPVISSHVHN